MIMCTIYDNVLLLNLNQQVHAFIVPACLKRWKGKVCMQIAMKLKTIGIHTGA